MTYKNSIHIYVKAIAINILLETKPISFKGSRKILYA